jgi:hypothetical protein
LKTDFEYWVEENLQRETTRILMKESIICYKNSAYRAALLLSYLAFIDIVRYRLFEAKKPLEVSENEWSTNHKHLENDDRCEKVVYELLTRNDGKYFKFSDSIRTQIMYWKDRRNDCAHLKDNSINASLVESFWLFMRCNLSKINVVGGQADLFSKIKKHFDETYTPYGTDYQYLVNEIQDSIDIIDFQPFLESLNDFITKLVNDNWFYMGDDTRFMYAILNTVKDRYYDIVKTYIKQNENLSSEMLQVEPKFLEHYKKDYPDYVREVWKTNIGKCQMGKVGCELLRNSIIPQKEIKEFIEELVYNNHDCMPSDEEINFLSNFGYSEKVKYVLEHITKDKGSFKWWIDKNTKFLEFYTKYAFKNKLNDVIMIFVENHAKSENADGVAYKLFTDIINNNKISRAFAQECCDEIGYKLDDITWIFNF